MLHFEPPDDRLAIGGPQALQRGLVPFDPLAADRDVERGRRFRRLRIRQLGGGGPSSEAARLVADTVEYRLAQIRLERPFVARLEVVEVAQGRQNRLLHQVLGVEQAARGRGQPASRPPPESGQASGNQPIERVAVPLADPGQEVNSGFEGVRGAGLRHQDLCIGPMILVARHRSKSGNWSYPLGHVATVDLHL